MIQTAIDNLKNKKYLTYQAAYDVIHDMMSGNCSDEEMASFLIALDQKGETAEEIAGAAAAMRDHAVEVHPAMETLDIVGTGGDKSYSFNISSTASLVIAAAGMPVAKHGNRSASSKSGAADCLEALGISLNQDPALAERLLDEIGICFMFAQNYHTSMKHVAGARKALGTRTIFNLLGPITNPARPTYQLLGVYKESLVQPLVGVIKNLGVQRGMVVYGQDVMDEISISAPSTAIFFDGDEEEAFEIRPQDYGFPSYSKDEIVGGDPQENAQITRDILSGDLAGAKRDIVLLNAGAGLYVSRKAQSIDEGIDLARQAIDSKAAYDLLTTYIQKSQGE